MNSGSRKAFEVAGYDQEEMYFHKVNQALIERRKTGRNLPVASTNVLEFKKRESSNKPSSNAYNQKKKAA